MKVESVKLDERGRIQRSTKKLRGRKTDHKTRELKQFGRKKLESMTKSDKHYDHGVFKNARVMTNAKKESFTPQWEMDIHKERVKYPYDGRCHPAKTNRS